MFSSTKLFLKLIKFINKLNTLSLMLLEVNFSIKKTYKNIRENN